MQKQKQNVFSVRNLTYYAVLIAMQLVLSKFLVIMTPVKRMGFSYAPIVFSALTLGPGVTAIIGATADLLGAFLFPQGPFFPGFTLTAALSGFIYGLFLYRKNLTWIHVVLARIAVIVFCHWGLNTLWLSIMGGKAMSLSFTTRILPDLIQLPLDFIVLFAVVAFAKRLPNHLRP